MREIKVLFRFVVEFTYHCIHDVKKFSTAIYFILCGFIIFDKVFHDSVKTYLHQRNNIGSEFHTSVFLHQTK